MSTTSAWTLRTTEQIVAGNLIVSALEVLTSLKSHRPGELFDWNVAQTRHQVPKKQWVRRLKAFMGSQPGVAITQTMKLAGGLTLLTPRLPAWARAAALLAVTGACGWTHMRSPYGGDGSEHLVLLTAVALLPSAMMPSNDRVADITLKYIAAQSALSYTAAGLSKAVSPSWSMGDATRDVLRTRMYGHERAYRFLERHPQLGRAMNKHVIVFETLFPLIFFVGPRTAAGLLAHSGVFHLANAVFMGLNRFFPAFLATYPSIAYASPSLRKLLDQHLDARTTGGMRNSFPLTTRHAA